MTRKPSCALLNFIEICAKYGAARSAYGFVGAFSIFVKDLFSGLAISKFYRIFVQIDSNLSLSLAGAVRPQALFFNIALRMINFEANNYELYEWNGLESTEEERARRMCN